MNQQKLLHKLIGLAQHSSFFNWLLNRLLWRIIPFNKAHKPKIVSFTHELVRVELPYINPNKNHINGMHACALATLCEYACGIGLLKQLDVSVYRIILKEIKVSYHSQAKEAVYVHFNLPNTWMNETLLPTLNKEGSMEHTFTIDAFTDSLKHVCTAQVTWQFKAWELVKNKA